MSILVNLSCQLGQIGGFFEKKKSKLEAKNVIRLYIAVNLGEKCFFCNPKLSRYSKYQISVIYLCVRNNAESSSSIVGSTDTNNSVSPTVPPQFF